MQESAQQSDQRDATARRPNRARACAGNQFALKATRPGPIGVGGGNFSKRSPQRLEQSRRHLRVGKQLAGTHGGMFEPLLAFFTRGGVLTGGQLAAMLAALTRRTPAMP